MFNDDSDLSEQERSALAALPRELAPGDLLEERVVRALRREGHFNAAAPLRRQWGSRLLRVAAAISLFAGGVATGHYVLSQQSAVTDATPVKQASVTSQEKQPSSRTQTVKNGETVVDEREMWL